MQNIVLKKKGLPIDIAASSEIESPWHILTIVDISGLRQKYGRQTDMLGSVHKVNDVVRVLEVEATTPPARLVSVKYFPGILRKKVGNLDWCCL